MESQLANASANIGRDSKLQLNKYTQGDEEVHPLSRAKIKIYISGFLNLFQNLEIKFQVKRISKNGLPIILSRGKVMRDKKSEKSTTNNKSKQTTKGAKNCK